VLFVSNDFSASGSDPLLRFWCQAGQMDDLTGLKGKPIHP
jgi:hypothetical protein